MMIVKVGGGDAEGGCDAQPHALPLYKKVYVSMAVTGERAGAEKHDQSQCNEPGH